MRWLKWVAVLAPVAVAFRWIITTQDRRHRVRSGVAPTIGGDTWPPVPVNPTGKV